MATNVTIGQISSGSSLSTADYIEIEASGISKKIDMQILANYMTPCGAYIDMAYAKTPSASFPAVALDSDKTISVTNYPILVPELRAAPATVTLTAGTVVTSININMTAGSTITSVDSAFTIILAGIIEEYAVQSAYSICVTIGGTDYTILSASTVIGISGTIATGATTMTIYPHRIVGTTNSAIVFKDAGRALMSVDGKLRIAGLRRRHHFQGHYHQGQYNIGGAGSRVLVNSVSVTASKANAGLFDSSDEPTTDGTNGTPITGRETEPNNTSVYRYLWAQAYTP
jgi:hypothetical protein